MSGHRVRQHGLISSQDAPQANDWITIRDSLPCTVQEAPNVLFHLEDEHRILGVGLHSIIIGKAVL